MSVQVERRRFFRINDTVRVAWRALTPEEVENLGSIPKRPMDIYSLISSLENKIAHSLNQLRIKDPAGADLIDLINQKVNCVVNHLEAESVLVPQLAHRQQEVNISACGMAFYADKDLVKEQIILLDIALQPSNVHITSYGAIVASEPNQDSGEYYLRVDFKGMDEADQELLIQHVVKRQSTLLRNQRVATQTLGTE